MLELNKSQRVSMERRVVSYTVNQYHPNAGYKWDIYVEDIGASHMDDIKARGFDEVVVCVTELDMASKGR